MPGDEPQVPFAGEAARLTLRERYAVPALLRPDGCDTSFDLGKPFIEERLHSLGRRAYRSAKLRLMPSTIGAAILSAGVVGDSLAGAPSPVTPPEEMNHRQSAPVASLMYWGRYRNTSLSR
jgi:hypothetical protein